MNSGGSVRDWVQGSFSASAPVPLWVGGSTRTMLGNRNWGNSAGRRGIKGGKNSGCWSREGGKGMGKGAGEGGVARRGARRKETLAPILFVLALMALASLQVQGVEAYSGTVTIPLSQFIFSSVYEPAPSTPGGNETVGFHRNHPICTKSATWTPSTGTLYAKVYASTPTSGGGQPNAKATATISYPGTYSRPFSSVTASGSPSLTVINFRSPTSMGTAGYGNSGPSLSYTAGGTSYTVSVSLYAYANYWYPNNEFVTDHAISEVRLTVPAPTLTFYWTEVTISASTTSATVGQPITFTATPKDGKAPYTFSWNFGNGATSTAQNPTYAYPSAGTYTVTCTARDSAGIADTKTIQITVTAPSYTLTVQSNTGGTTSPAAGSYTYSAGSNVQVTAYPSSGYTFAYWLLDGVNAGSSNPITVTMSSSRTIRPVFNQQTYTLTIRSSAGGSTNPAVGTYTYASGSNVQITATALSGYTFSNWILDTSIDMTGSGTPSSSISVYMDRDRVLTANFESEDLASVRPCYLRDGTQLSRVVLGENVGINVTVTLPNITQPTNATLTAWLEGAYWWDWSSNSYKTTLYQFTRTVTTDASGRISVALGSEIDGATPCYAANLSDPLGTRRLARAQITVGSQTYYFANTWRVDNVMAIAEFDYNLTGINATFRFVYATDWAPAKGREGLYITGLASGDSQGVYSVWDGNRFMWERFSTPCDRNGVSRLYIPYSWLNSVAQSRPVSMPIYYNFNYYGITTPIAAQYAIKNNITYTALAPMLYFFNSTCAVVEPFDWGDKANMAGVEGVYAYLYWDTLDPWNGTRGLLPAYGPSVNVPLYRAGGRVYMNFTAVNPSLAPIPVGEQIDVPTNVTSIKGILLTYPDIYTVMQYGAKRLWLQLLPGHTSGILYNPVQECPILLAASLG